MRFVAVSEHIVLTALKQTHIWSESFNPIGFTTKCCRLHFNLILENVIIKLSKVCLRHRDTVEMHTH